MSIDIGMETAASRAPLIALLSLARGIAQMLAHAMPITMGMEHRYVRNVLQPVHRLLVVTRRVTAPVLW